MRDKRSPFAVQYMAFYKIRHKVLKNNDHRKVMRNKKNSRKNTKYIIYKVRSYRKECLPAAS
jgi:hypothetical protein